MHIHNFKNNTAYILMGKSDRKYSSLLTIIMIRQDRTGVWMHLIIIQGMMQLINFVVLLIGTIISLNLLFKVRL